MSMPNSVDLRWSRAESLGSTIANRSTLLMPQTASDYYEFCSKHALRRVAQNVLAPVHAKTGLLVIYFIAAGPDEAWQIAVRFLGRVLRVIRRGRIVGAR